MKHNFALTTRNHRRPRWRRFGGRFAQAEYSRKARAAGPLYAAGFAPPPGRSGAGGDSGLRRCSRNYFHSSRKRGLLKPVDSQLA
jgi:hypothetical protein